VQRLYNEDKNDPAHFIRTEQSGVLELARVKLVNASFVKTQGLDFGTGVKLDLQDVGLTESKAGAIAVAVDASYVLKYDIPRRDVADIELENGDTVPVPGCESDSCNVAGLRNFENIASPLPRLRMNIPLSWSDEHHAIAFVVHYISSYKDDANSDPETGELVKIDANATLDLSYGYTLKELIGESTTIRVGMINVFDSDPPPVVALAGYDVFTHDPRGRLFYARVSQEF
jgi:hypothetical protein